MGRNYKKIVVGGILTLLILLACVLGVVIYFANTKEEADVETKSEEIKKSENKEEEMGVSEEEPSMELVGLPDDVLEIMGITRVQVADTLKEWTEKNGYSSADGAVFQEPIYIRFDNLKFSVSFQLTFGEEGNGTTPEDDVLTMDYYKQQNQIFFHK